jgi:hypothetical protein
MVPLDQINFEPPEGAGGELWPFVVAYDFAFHIMTFVSDHMPLRRSEGPLKASSKAQKGKRSKYALRLGTYWLFRVA